MFNNAKDIGPDFNAVTWTFTAVTTVIVGLRLLSRTLLVSKNDQRRVSTNNAGLDDAFTLLAMVSILACNVSISLATNVGVGKHVADVPPENVNELRKRIIIMNVLVIWAFSLPKLAIIALLKRILNLNRLTEAIFWTLAGISQALILTTAIVWFQQCSPVEYGWDKSIDGHCWSFTVIGDLGYFTASLSTALDLLFALYPIPVILKLNMTLRRKLVCCLAFAFCGVAFIVSVIKLAAVGSVVEQEAVDPSYAIVPLVFWGVIEANLLVVTASLPTIGPFVRFVSRRAKQVSGSAPKSASGVVGSEAGFHRNERSVPDSLRAPSLPGSSHTEDLPLVGIMHGKGEIGRKTEVVVSHEARTPGDVERGQGENNAREWRERYNR